MSFIQHILFNGIIHTLDGERRVSALAISGGRVVAAGSDDEILAFGGAATKHEDLNGRVVLPGMIDAHVHWLNFAAALDAVELFDVPTKDEALRRVRARAARTPAGQWITGYGWAQDVWPDKQFPTAHDLDSITQEHPIYLQARSGHAAWTNSAALRVAGIDRTTPNPAAGEIARDERGEPTGILLEPAAMNLVAAHIPPLTTERRADQMLAAQHYALSLGMTGLHDFDDPECLRALQVLRERGQLGIRVVKNINKAFLTAALESGLRWGFGDDWLRIGGLKIFADGAMGPRTAAMFEPYDGEPDNYGIIVTDKEEIIELVQKASRAGLPATVHAIGDRAVHDVLDAYAVVRAAEAEWGISRNSRRHRIEHVQLIHPNDVNRLAELDLIASMQPIHATSDYPMADRYWGARAPYSYNPRLQLDRGVIVAFGSDAPYDALGPLRGIHAAVTRRRPDGSPGKDGWNPTARTTVAEAVQASTFGPAYAAGMEDRLGKLAVGYLADLVVLDRDPFAIPADELLDIQVQATMVGGVWRFGGID